MIDDYTIQKGSLPKPQLIKPSKLRLPVRINENEFFYVTFGIALTLEEDEMIVFNRDCLEFINTIPRTQIPTIQNKPRVSISLMDSPGAPNLIGNKMCKFMGLSLDFNEPCDFPRLKHYRPLALYQNKPINDDIGMQEINNSSDMFIGIVTL